MGPDELLGDRLIDMCHRLGRRKTLICALVIVLSAGGASAQTVYDFSSNSGVDRFAYGNSIPSTIPPIDNAIPSTELLSADYTAISLSDDARHSTGNFSGGTRAGTRYVFTVAEAPAYITQIDVLWEGGASAAATGQGFLNVWIWDAVTLTYVLVGSDQQVAPPDVVISGSFTASPSDYLDGSNSVTVLVTNTKNNNGLLTDYVSITVTAVDCLGDGDCDDSNVCTDDVCNAGTCENPNNTAACDDGLYCNGADTCSGGSCSVHAGDPCTGGPECADTCDETADDCNTAAGTICTEDGNVCTDNECDGLGACVAIPNSVACDDGLYCNGTDTCSGGTCSVHTGDPCAGGPECADSCNETAGDCYAAAGTTCTDDGNVCTDNECDGAGVCTATNNTAPCDDGIFCNGADTCSGGTCSVHPGDPCAGGSECADTCDEVGDTCNLPSGTACTDDGNVCTDNECDGLGACVGVPNTVPCDDGSYCNGADTCSGGTCSVHVGDPCAGGPECADTCDEVNDSCNTPASTACTDDGNVCTDNECDGLGTCVAINNTAACDDGVFCNGADTCSGGTCSVHPGDPCAGGSECADTCDEVNDTCNLPASTACTDDGNVCTDNECDGFGACVAINNSDPCDDELYCNGTDTCSGGTCSVHVGDPCTGGPECADTCNETVDDCFTLAGTTCTDDGNVCTDNECDGSGSCVAINNVAACDDGVYCNGTDTCSGGTCSSHAGDPCTGGPECADTCDEANDTCNLPNDTPCTDDLLYCTGTETCQGGVCTSAGDPCLGGPECADTCDEANDTCNLPDDTPCTDDLLYCTGTETCQGGVCTSAGDPCVGGPECADTCDEFNDTCNLPDDTPCTDDLLYCSGAETCQGGVCSSAGDPCVGGPECADTCDEANDTCNLPDDTPCTDDLLYCSGAETCQSGVCTSGGDPCVGGPECADTCDEFNDTCNLPDDTPCTDDLLYCSGAETCQGGVCTSAGDPCVGGPECADTCDEVNDSCNTPASTACTDDGNVCTDNECDGLGVCVAVNNTAACDDGVYCNGADTCSDGTCSSHAGDPCTGGPECADTCNETAGDCYTLAGTACTDDGNVCTDNECDGFGTCAAYDNIAPCDDALYCNGADTCSGGTCSVHVGDPCAGGPECADTCNETADDCYTLAGTACTDDGNVCTDNECDGAGTCTAYDNVAPCDDGVYCNGADTCSGGTCSSHAGDPCTGGPECADSCNETADDCNTAAGTTCTDDGNVCTDNECDGFGTCTAYDNVAPCDDGVYCNGADTCSAGTCSVHPGDPCLGGPECADSCDEVNDTCNLPASTACTDDGNVCTDNRCDGLGACVAVNNTDACDDGDPCNVGEACSGGLCTGGGAVDCSGAGDQCNDASCDVAGPEGNCETITPVLDGTICDDGVACTNAECQTGSCVFVAHTAEVSVGLQLQAIESAVTRDVTFVITTCGGSVDSRVIGVSVDETGLTTDPVVLSNVDADAGWLSVREGHTLRRLRPLSFSSCAASVNLTGVANELVAGDFQTDVVSQDGLVDITDFSILAVNFLDEIDSAMSTGADATANGMQGLEDFTVIQANFLTVGDPADSCAAFAGTETDLLTRVINLDLADIATPELARHAIPVDSLAIAGAKHADLNGDGVVDTRDIRAFAHRHNLSLQPDFERTLTRLESRKTGRRQR